MCHAPHSTTRRLLAVAGCLAAVGSRVCSVFVRSTWMAVVVERVVQRVVQRVLQRVVERAKVVELVYVEIEDSLPHQCLTWRSA